MTKLSLTLKSSAISSLESCPFLSSFTIPLVFCTILDFAYPCLKTELKLGIIENLKVDKIVEISFKDSLTRSSFLRKFPKLNEDFYDLSMG